MSSPLTPDDMVSRYPGTTRGSWAQHRYNGTGPAFFKVGRKVYYREEDVLQWEESNRRTSTGALNVGAC
ncbi:helix-turn-helix transcriptional regulator [Corynebacterium falsenii]|uniref:helix-turn-helix transcriptional regulator n=1 Tax=Corynebacterium falsenii TaxID=108486 RepID=UPI001D9B8975|nr:helix-turn-helix domain-containing protein [Corynebacterium falsenii]HJF13066.1 helix-turn-helix domain-containing protein [Corynebacterium falsenii]